jgi:predicted Zn-dependent protease
VTVHRREVLGALGVAAGSTLLGALGCGAHAPTIRRAPQVSGEVRTWLHDAVARLASTYPVVHALAVSRHRTTAAFDVLGSGLAHLHASGVVLTVRGHDGTWREHITNELTSAGVEAATRALGASRQRASIDCGRAPAPPDEPPHVDDRDLRQRAERLLGSGSLSSRIVYAAALVDVDDAVVWSVAPGRDLAQRLVRIRQAATRAAWNGARPVVRDVEHAWTGWLDDHPLTPDDLTATDRAALELTTPGSFDDGERAVILDPSVVAILFDTAVRGLLTSAAVRRSDVAARGAVPQLASPLVTLVDDPTAPGAYGSFAFDDEGEPAAPITLLDAGRVVARLSDRASGGTADRASGSIFVGASDGTGASGGTGRGRRPGHLARVEPSSSHLQLVPGTLPVEQLYGDGVILEGGLGATFDPATDRIRIACARARELRAGNTTGRVYADVELVGTLTALLSAVDAVASTPDRIALHGPSEHEPCWRSISAPAVRTRGLVRARRSRA